MQRQWYFLYHSKTNPFWMCDTDVVRIATTANASLCTRMKS
jgi:hypothetical protein